MTDEPPSAAMELINCAALMIWATSSGFAASAVLAAFWEVAVAGIAAGAVTMPPAALVAEVAVAEGRKVCERGAVLFRNRDTIFI